MTSPATHAAPTTSGGANSVPLAALRAVLADYVADHPDADADLYHHDAKGTAVRVVDPTFRGMHRTERHDRLWSYLGRLSAEELADVMYTVKIAPGEEDDPRNRLFEEERPRSVAAAA